MRPDARPSSVVRQCASRVARHALLASVVLSPGACAWFTDFKQQPKVDPWESVADSIPPRANPQMSVPIYGTAAPGFVFGRGSTHGAVDSMAAITNPVAADSISIRNGGQQYAINCAVCHGALGAADGPVTKFARFVLPIGAGTNAVRMSDGAIFGIIRNGRGLMPPYNRLEERERWDVVNYLRTIQSGSAPAAVRVGRPGETGDLVPGASLTAPTRPAPYFKTPPPTPVPAAPAPRTP